MTERLRAIPTIQAIQEEPCGLELEHSPAEANARVARDNRAMLDRHGITAVDFIGAAGSGKTTLITRLVEMLRSKIGIAVVNGDVAVAEQNVPVVQIVTGIGCHLDANMLALAMMKIELEKTGLILIENCGELTHPSEFPLGCKARVLVVSVVLWAAILIIYLGGPAEALVVQPSWNVLPSSIISTYRSIRAARVSARLIVVRR